MMECPQFKGQSVFQHGQSVRVYARDLINSLQEGSPLSNWRIPKWCSEYKEQLLANLHSWHDIELYTVFHDIGKPRCHEIDSEGKYHFPNHAQVSKDCFLKATGNQLVANLIGWDMDLHVLSADELTQKFSEWSIKDASTLALVALAELHSNANFLDPLGISSNSFKVKWKKLDRRGNQLCKHYFKEN